MPLLEEMVGAYRPALLALTVATALVLLIACINVAGLLLARGVARQRALAVYAALGASRWRLVRQLLTESLMLGVGGGVLGLAAASTVLRAVPALVPGDIARLDEVGIDPVDPRVHLRTVVSQPGCCSAPRRPSGGRGLDLARTLNEGSEQSTGGFRLLRSNRARAALAVAQVALALVLLTGAGVLLRSFVRLITVDRGYDPANVIAAAIPIPDLTSRPDMTPESMAEVLAAGRRFQESLVQEMDRLAVLSDVEAAGVSSRLPLASGGGSATVFRVAGTAPPTDPLDLTRARVNVVSPGYFDAMRLRLRSGRARITRRDGAESPLVLVGERDRSHESSSAASRPSAGACCRSAPARNRGRWSGSSPMSATPGWPSPGRRPRHTFRCTSSNTRGCWPACRPSTRWSPCGRPAIRWPSFRFYARQWPPRVRTQASTT